MLQGMSSVSKASIVLTGLAQDTVIVITSTVVLYISSQVPQLTMEQHPSVDGFVVTRSQDPTSLG